MKTAFFHDCVFVVDTDNTYYTKGGLDEKKLAEYVEYFGEMIVFTRSRKIRENDDIDKMSKASTTKVNFESINNLNVFSLFFGKNRKKIRQIVEKADFVIVRMPSYIGHIAIQEAKKLNKNYLVEMVACPWDALWNYGKITKKICALPTYMLNKFDIYNAKNVIYVSDEFLQKRYPTKGKNIGCSDVILNEIKDSILERRLDKIKERNTSVLKLATVASVELKYKGQEYVFRAISELIKKGKIVEYYLAGGGDFTRLKNIAQKLHIEKYIHFLGSLPHEKVFDLVDDIDIYIQPSLQEGLPRALIEAMSRGCPAIGSTAGGIPELLDKRYIFRKKDYRKIEELLVNLNEEELMQMAKKNYEKAKQFDKQILKEKRIAFYKSIGKE